MNMILMLLQGTPLTLYGEEIGMLNNKDMMLAWANVENNSHLQVYKELAKLRESETILFGDTQIEVESENVFILSRVKKGNPGYLLIVNFGDQKANVAVNGFNNMAERGILTLGIPKSESESGAAIDMTTIDIEPHSSYLITFVPKF